MSSDDENEQQQQLHVFDLPEHFMLAVFQRIDLHDRLVYAA